MDGTPSGKGGGRDTSGEGSRGGPRSLLVLLNSTNQMSRRQQAGRRKRSHTYNREASGPPTQLLPTVLQSSAFRSPDPNNRTTPFVLSTFAVSC